MADNNINSPLVNPITPKYRPCNMASQQPMHKNKAAVSGGGHDSEECKFSPEDMAQDFPMHPVTITLTFACKLWFRIGRYNIKSCPNFAG